MNLIKLTKALEVDEWAKDLHFTSHLFDRDYSSDRLVNISLKNLSLKTGILIIFFIAGCMIPFLVAYFMDPYWFLDFKLKPINEFGYGNELFGTMAPFLFNSFFALLFGTILSTKIKSLLYIIAPYTVFGYGNAVAILIAGLKKDSDFPLEIIVISCLASISLSLFFALRYPRKRLKFSVKTLPLKTIIFISALFLIVRLFIYMKTGVEPDVTMFIAEPFSIYATFTFLSIGTIIFYREFDFILEKLNQKWPTYITWYIAQRLVLWIFVYLFAAMGMAVRKKIN